MQISGSVIFVSGANRGLGFRLVEASLSGGAKRVYAAARDVTTLGPLIALDPARVVPVALDIDVPDEIEKVVSAAPDVKILFNNAGVLDFSGPLEVTDALIERNMTTNFLGTFRMSKAFGNALAESGGGTIVNILTFLTYVSAPVFSAYNASKAASWSMSMSLRAAYAKQDVRLVNVFPTTIDTEMVAGLDKSKASPADIATAILAGLEAGEEDIYPLGAADTFAAWRADPKAIEAQFAKIA